MFPDSSGSGGRAALKSAALSVVSGGGASETACLSAPPLLPHLPHASPARFYLCDVFLLIRAPVLCVGPLRCFNKRYHREAHQITTPGGSLPPLPDLYQSAVEPPRREESAFQQSEGDLQLTSWLCILVGADGALGVGGGEGGAGQLWRFFSTHSDVWDGAEAS